MPWLPAFGEVVPKTGRARHDPDGSLVVDPAALLADWPGGVTVDDPTAGRVEGAAALGALGGASEAWLRARAARVLVVAVTVGPGRSVGEFDVELSERGRSVVLPIAVAVEPDSDRRCLAVRIYHSNWPLLGRHLLRPPLLEGDPAAREADIVGEYQAALAAGDARRIVATFEPDGCFREPAGPLYRRCGTSDLLDFFSGFFAVGGGIILEHCTVTEDGVRTALEFNAVRWGSHDMPHQAGIAVYERGATGRIAQARVYDDVTPPFD